MNVTFYLFVIIFCVEIQELSDVQSVVLNPFGEPIIEADIMHAFQQVDKNEDGILFFYLKCTKP